MRLTAAFAAHPLAHLGGYRHEPLVVIPVALGAGVPDAAYDGERVGAFSGPAIIARFGLTDQCPRREGLR